LHGREWGPIVSDAMTTADKAGALRYLESSFAVMDYCDLLHWLQIARKTGVLRVSCDATISRIYFKEGAIIASSSNDPRLLLGQFLMAHGRIDETTLREFLKIQEGSGQNLGKLLVDAGKISESELQRLVTAKAEEVVFSVSEKPGGNFRFEPNQTPPKDTMSVDLNVELLLLESVRRQDDLNMIREVLPSLQVVLHKTEQAPDPPTVASYMGRKLYESIDGKRTLAEIILLCRTSEYLAGHFLLRLVERGIVRVGDARGPEATVTQDASAVGRLRELVASGEYEEAVDLIDRCGLRADGDEFLALLVAKAEAGFLATAYHTEIPPDAVPELAKSGTCSANRDLLSGEELFLLDLIDGHWDVRSLGWIAPMRKIDVVRGLLRLRKFGCIELQSQTSQPDPTTTRMTRQEEAGKGEDAQGDIERAVCQLGA